MTAIFYQRRWFPALAKTSLPLRLGLAAARGFFRPLRKTGPYLNVDRHDVRPFDMASFCDDDCVPKPIWIWAIRPLYRAASRHARRDSISFWSGLIHACSEERRGELSGKTFQGVPVTKRDQGFLHIGDARSTCMYCANRRHGRRIEAAFVEAIPPVQAHDKPRGVVSYCTYLLPYLAARRAKTTEHTP